MAKKSVKNNNKMNNNKMSKKNNNRTRLSAKPSFAVRLGAFLLEGLKEDVKFDEKKGFSGKQAEVAGALPYFHMNITEKQFKNMLKGAKTANTDALADICNKSDLNNVLKSVGFNCNRQAASGIQSLQKGLIDSINNRFEIRKNGQKKVSQILEKMRWQCKNKIIPASSIEWGK